MANTIPISDIARRSNALPPEEALAQPQSNSKSGSSSRIRSVNKTDVDVQGLKAKLFKTVEGEVRFDVGSRALYSTDGSNYRQVPIGVVIPKHEKDVIATVAACRKYGAPVLSRGGGTSLAGQCCNVAVVIDFSKYMNKVLEIDPKKRTARVQPGCVLDDLRKAAEKYGLTFGPDPATHTHNTLGGMIGNDSCGSHSLLSMWEGDGLRTADNVYSLNVLTYDGTRMTVGETSPHELENIIAHGGRRGEIYGAMKKLIDREADNVSSRFPRIPRRVSGYNFEYLLPENKFNIARALVGSEGTLVTVLEATLNLVPKPKASSLMVFGFEDAFAAADAAAFIVHKYRPIACEGIDDILIGYMKKKGLHPQDLKLMPGGSGWLVTEFGADSKEEADRKAHEAVEDYMKHGREHAELKDHKLYDDPIEEKLVWQIRESALGATADIPGEPANWPGWEDSAVSPDKMGPYLRDLRHLMEKHGYKNVSLYGHFGQGCLHCRIPFDLKTGEGVANFRSFMTDAARLVTSYGGSLSGEHGDGQARAELLPIMFGQQIVDSFREFKTIWDPEWKMNPGKVVDAYKIDENLRLGPHYAPWEPETHFAYREDASSFSEATLRCVGVGNCRQHEGATMCPSYQVTREEMHSTRGRSRLLFEMLQGSPLEKKWKEESVKEALDLCLACKGCKGDCPVNVDMATYKAEFLSHYFDGKARPRSAYAFGWIAIWSRFATKAPWLVNFTSQMPIFSSIAKLIAGVDSRRRIPPFALQNFKSWFQGREKKNLGKEKVILWPDTFNNYFHPRVGMAATDVLEAAGFDVIVPQANLCCGRPLYDYGFLDMAKVWLRQILDELRPEIQAGIPLVGLEPSCLAVFRDELVNLFPCDEDAQRLKKQSFLLSEFLEKKAPDFELPTLPRKALLHGHCHHKSLMKMNDEEAVLKKMKIDYEMPDTGCCGMAGAFGFEAGDHYDVSIKAGERVLLPKVRSAEKDELVIADGFSCREQISQGTDRHAMHLAEVIQMGLQRRSGEDLPAAYPERKYITDPNPAAAVNNTVFALLAVAAIGVALWALSSQSNNAD